MPEEFFETLSNHATPPVYRFFNGKEWVESASGKTVEIHSPIDDSVVGALQVVTIVEIDAVMTSAKTGQAKWEATPLNQRVKIMHLAADWIRHFEEYLSTLLAKEIGKSMGEAKSEIVRTADLIDYYADEVQSMRGETLDSDNFPGYDKGRIGLIERVAWGTVLAIAPFNYPVNLTASKLAPALLMGNAVVFKPPTQGGISALHLAQAFLKAGVPEGALTCVTGTGSDIGDYLVSHPGIDCITFTGNSDTGEAIAKKAGMKTLVFECGGNNPALVLPDADMNLTAREIIKGAFSYAGQRCTAIKYVLGMPDTLASLQTVIMKQMPELVHMGDPRSPETKLVGPVVSIAAAEHIQSLIGETVKAGAKIITGGRRTNAFVEPTILSDVRPEMPAVREEVFGPVVSFITVKDIGEAVGIINASRFGLQASVFTQDEGAGIVVAKQLNVGTVQINGSPQRGPDHFPFLGVKRSGLGVQGVHYSLEEMSRLRPIVINKPR
ncbi:MAG: aldehyde dehydrogenase family protein [Candidatus Gottesmanbacteria bacterium]|nr:aldehyde dehydrogenase family protein [Candidatus Gottesmanbacteria bacterium]